MPLAFCSSGVCNSAACLKEMASELVALANQRGGPDNITVIVLQIGEPSPWLICWISERHSIPGSVAVAWKHRAGERGRDTSLPRFLLKL